MAKTTLDATDRKILRFLIKNARMPYLEIARECGISGAAIHQGSRLVVAPKSLGFDVCAFISIRVSDVKRQQDTVEQLRKIPEIVECHYITGSYNLMVKLYCVDNEHLMRTIFDHILQVQGVSSTQTYISLNESFQREIHVDCLDD